MKINTVKLSNRQTNGLQDLSKTEAWLYGPGTVLAKFIFWLIVFLSIIIEVDGQNNQVPEFIIPMVDTKRAEIVNTLDLYGDNDGVVNEIYHCSIELQNISEFDVDKQKLN